MPSDESVMVAVIVATMGMASTTSWGSVEAEKAIDVAEYGAMDTRTQAAWYRLISVEHLVGEVARSLVMLKKMATEAGRQPPVRRHAVGCT